MGLLVFLIPVLILHGIIHLYGFVNGMFLADSFYMGWKRIIPLPPVYEKLIGALWLVTAFILWATAFAIATNQWWWVVTAIVGAILSQTLVILHIKYAISGTLVNLILIAAIIWLR